MRNQDIRDIGKSDEGYITIGKDCDIGWDVVIDISGGVNIGDRVQVGRRTMIYTHDHEIKHVDWKERKITVYYPLDIEDDVFIGLGCIILPKVGKIGKGALIGAGSVVTKEVPAMETWAGNPAKKIGDRIPRE